MKPVTAALLLCVSSALAADETPQPIAGWEMTARSDLPNVLIIGDSISIGYTRQVRTLLKDRANVFRPMDSRGHPFNCYTTETGIARMKEWLGDRKWDVIHFNWGLHDLCYRTPESTVSGHRDKVHGKVTVPIEAYRANLDRLTTLMQASGARLIWASTTFVPDGEPGRFPGDELKYNRAAAEIMARRSVAVDDLHQLTAAFPASLRFAPGDVHFNDDGWQRMAVQVAASISAQLPAR
jgi:hypothetical protein